MFQKGLRAHCVFFCSALDDTRLAAAAGGACRRLRCGGLGLMKLEDLLHDTRILKGVE